MSPGVGLFAFLEMIRCPESQIPPAQGAESCFGVGAGACPPVSDAAESVAGPIRPERFQLPGGREGQASSAADWCGSGETWLTTGPVRR